MTLLSLALALGCLSLAAGEVTFRVKFEVETADGPGEFVVAVHEEWAPFGAARFKELVDVSANTHSARRLVRLTPGATPAGQVL